MGSSTSQFATQFSAGNADLTSMSHVTARQIRSVSLSQMSANVPLSIPGATRPDKKGKRRRTTAPPKQPSEVITIESEDEEDGDALQANMMGIQQKLAAIRARTAGEDQPLPNAPKRKRTKPDTENGQSRMDVRSMGYTPPPSSQTSRVGAATGFSRHTHKAATSNQPPSASIPTGLLQHVQPVVESIQPPNGYPSRPPPVPNQPSAPPAATEPVLCKEQADLVKLIIAGHNVFYTGSAGCGKSTVLKAMVKQLREIGKVVRIVAPTGKAALDINGSTTWTFAGWTPDNMKKPLMDLEKAAHGKFVSKRLRGTDVLVIDEISMVENHHFERLNKVMIAARGSDKAFGGVQIVVTGDFCQLPPVRPFQYCIHCGREQGRMQTNDGVIYKCRNHAACHDDDKWAFRSTAWKQCEFKHVNLTNIHRQSDGVFIKILQKLRMGAKLPLADRKLLLDHPSDTANAVKLFSTREEVKRINQAEFEKLKTSKVTYTCLDYWWWNEEKHPNLKSKGIRNQFDNSLTYLREHRLEASVEYKEGMLVVLLVNLDITAGLVNGSQGRIIGFDPYDPAKLPKASSNGSTTTGSFSSSSKRSGKRGRDRSEEPPDVQGGLRGEYAVLREGQIRHFITQPRNVSKQWPIVRFDNGVERTIFADCQVNELGDETPYSLLARTQIPLIAAWAMTIHKSQGMTLNRVIVDLARSFEEGQEYVALSRARSLDGLKVEGLGNGVGGGNKQVKDFLWQEFGVR